MVDQTLTAAVRRSTLMCAIAALTLLAAGLRAPTAHADEGGVYVGADAGYTLDSYRHADLNSAVVASLASSGEDLVLCCSQVHDKETPWDVDAGYRFSRYLGLEASYVQLGTVRYSALGTEKSLFGSGPLAVALNIKSRGPALALVGTLPLSNNLELAVRLGDYEGKTITDFFAKGSGGSNSGSDSKTSASLMGGIGMDYIVAAHWVVRLDYTHFNSLGEKILSRSFNVDLLTAGINYAF